MKNGIECERRPLFQEKSGFAPGNSFFRNWQTEFSWIGSQTDGWSLIDGLNKAFKISRKLSLDAVQKLEGQYFGSLFDDFLSFLVIFAGKINGLRLKNK